MKLPAQCKASCLSSPRTFEVNLLIPLSSQSHRSSSSDLFFCLQQPPSLYTKFLNVCLPLHRLHFILRQNVRP